jgi:hypothetical protein
MTVAVVALCTLVLFGSISVVSPKVARANALRAVFFAAFSIFVKKLVTLSREYFRAKYHCTVDLLFDWFGISCVTTGNFCFYLQNRLIQTGQTGGQQYSDTSPFSIPCLGQ